MNEIMNINGVECYEEDGIAYLKLETVARGLGFTTVATSGNKVVRWNRVEKYLGEFNFDIRDKRPNFIPENIFYRLAMKAKNETAEKFQAKIADEVLPSIRKHGGYLTPKKIEEVLLNPDTIIKLAQNLKEEQEKNKALTADVERMKPKEVFADAVTTSDNCILIGELAKLLKQNGVDIGANRLFEWLRKNKYLIRRKGLDYNTPTQRAMNMGLFRVKKTAITHSDGHVTVNKTTKVTGKGQLYFINKFKEMFVA